MKLVIFGASGNTGRLITELALQKGHEVTAFVRSPEKLTNQNERLHAFKGDILDADAVKASLAGQDAALSVLNAFNPEDYAVFEQGATNIVNGMKAQGVKRVVYCSSFGVPDGFERDPYYEQNFRQGTLKAVYGEGRKAEAVITGSGLDWTLVRPPMLLDTPPTGSVRVVDIPPLDMQTISRADLADYIVKCVEDPQYIHTANFVGN